MKRLLINDGNVALTHESACFKSIYSRNLVTRTLKGNEKQFQLAGNSSYPSSSNRGSTAFPF